MYGVQATVEEFLLNFAKFDEKTRGEIYDALFEEIYLNNVRLTDSMLLPVTTEKQGETLLSIFTDFGDEPTDVIDDIVADKITPIQRATRDDAQVSRKTRDIDQFPSLSVAVPSSTPGVYHTVMLTPGTKKAASCTCQNYRIQKNPYCKHMKGVDSGLYR